MITPGAGLRDTINFLLTDCQIHRVLVSFVLLCRESYCVILHINEALKRENEGPQEV